MNLSYAMQLSEGYCEQIDIEGTREDIVQLLNDCVNLRQLGAIEFAAGIVAPESPEADIDPEAFAE